MEKRLPHAVDYCGLEQIQVSAGGHEQNMIQQLPSLLVYNLVLSLVKKRAPQSVAVVTRQKGSVTWKVSIKPVRISIPASATKLKSAANVRQGHRNEQSCVPVLLSNCSTDSLQEILHGGTGGPGKLSEYAMNTRVPRPTVSWLGGDFDLSHSKSRSSDSHICQQQANVATRPGHPSCDSLTSGAPHIPSVGMCGVPGHPTVLSPAATACPGY